MVARTLVALVVVGGCGGGGGAGIDGHAGDGNHDSGSGDATMVDDGTPTRQACTSHFGSAITEVFGRLDGYLVAIVPPSNMSSCNDDESHVHLQIRANAEIYDIAIDDTDGTSGTDDVHTAAQELAMPGSVAWAEGWHADTQALLSDYPALGVHSTDLPLVDHNTIISTLQSELAEVNHISVYATGYGPTGAHLVHRNGDGNDGLLVTQPLSSPAHIRFFAFSDQTF